MEGRMWDYDEEEGCFEMVTGRHTTLWNTMVRGLINITVLMCLISGLLVVSHFDCIYVWGIMGIAIMLMIFAWMHHLWIVVAASFVVLFYVGCDVGGPWLTVTSKISMR